MAEDKKDQLEEAEIKEIEQTDVPQDESTTDAPMKIKKNSKLKRFFSTRKGKVLAVLTAVLLVVAVLAAIPSTRYGIAGSFMKKDVQVSVFDASTQKPVSDAEVKVGGQSAKTSASGEAMFKDVPVGEYTVTITKKYYKDTSSTYVVPVLSSPKHLNTNLQATGRQVEVKVTNYVTKAVLAKASVVVGGTSAITDDKGVATVVLPADQKTLSATASLVGYNDKKTNITVTEQTGKNNISLTPEGKLFYLSNQTGNINVMKSDLDGSNAAVVVKGTGNEERNTTSLLAARDWRYLVLSAKRNAGQKGQLYLVDTKTGSLKTIDQGDANFDLVGWSGHRFIYDVYRNGKKAWESGKQSLKVYDADSDQLSVLDQTTAEGTNTYDYRGEAISTPYILEGKIIYVKVWNSGNKYYFDSPIGKKSSIMSIDPDGSNKKTVKEFTVQHAITIESKLYEPQEISYKVTPDTNQPSFYRYEDGVVNSVSNTDEKFYDFYPTYLVSPSGNKTFWYEYRDGKNTLFVGDKNGKNGTMIASLSDYSTYGWFGDDYLLLSKGGSELYIVAANKPISGDNQPIKITNYFKPGTNYPGYGYGYGGI
jgi:hypothetical protein